MNILFVSSAGHYGGTERWITMAVGELERRGHTVWVCCPDVPHASQFIRRERLIPEVPSSIWDTQGRKKLSNTMTALAIDVVIPVSQRMYFVCGLITRRLDVAVVLRLGIVRLPWRPVIDWFGYGIWPDATIVNTASIKRVLSLAPFVRRDRIHVIYNGINKPPSKVETIDHGCFKISFVGTVSWRKGTGHLISALSHLPAHLRDNIRLEVIGDGPGLTRCRRQVKRLRLENQVHFTGHVNNPADLLKSSDLFVLLSSPIKVFRDKSSWTAGTAPSGACGSPTLFVPVPGNQGLQNIPPQRPDGRDTWSIARTQWCRSPDRNASKLFHLNRLCVQTPC